MSAHLFIEVLYSLTLERKKNILFNDIHRECLWMRKNPSIIK